MTNRHQGTRLLAVPTDTRRNGRVSGQCPCNLHDQLSVRSYARTSFICWRGVLVLCPVGGFGARSVPARTSPWTTRPALVKQPWKGGIAAAWLCHCRPSGAWGRWPTPVQGLSPIGIDTSGGHPGGERMRLSGALWKSRSLRSPTPAPPVRAPPRLWPRRNRHFRTCVDTNGLTPLATDGRPSGAQHPGLSPLANPVSK